MEQKIYTTDEIILQAIKEKRSFETHRDDISYAHHHKKSWLRIDLTEFGNKYDKKTLNLLQLKNVIDKQIKVK